MSHEYTPLVLDDIVHIVSPSPAPQQSATDDLEMTPRAKTSSPEPVQETDILQMRKRVMEIHISHKGDSHTNAREKELADMVLRLTNSPIPDAEQIVRQADMISALTLQRDLLLHQAEEQRLRWASEKEGWARMAEALIARQMKNRFASDRDDVQEVERFNNALETENKGLRQRLNETQTRMQVLEAELTRLRPLLLMQPLISSTSITTPRKHRKRRKDTNQAEDEIVDASDDDARGVSEVLDTPTHSIPSQSTPKSKSRHSAHFQSSTNQHKRRSSLKSSSRGLSADAKVEHLLLAARKVGKERVSLMSGMMQQMEERERERPREDTASTVVATTPKTPKRVAPYPGYMPPESGCFYLPSPMRPGSEMQPIPVFIPAFPPPVFQTPSSTTVASAASSSQKSTKADARNQNPQTPLDSLLSAARSMMRNGGEDPNDEESGRTLGSRRSLDDDVPDSPLPKRQKLPPRHGAMVAQELAGPSTPTAAKHTRAAGSNAAVGRVRSALDVLADQAAAFSSQEVSTWTTPVQGKGKGKERVDASEQLFGAVSKPKAKTRTRRLDVDADASPFFECPSRSRSPVPNSNADPPTKDGSTSEVPGDPGGRADLPPSLLQGDDADARDTSGVDANLIHRSSKSPTPRTEQDVDKTPTQSFSAVSKPPLTVHWSQSKATPAAPYSATLPPDSQPILSSSRQGADSVVAQSNRVPSPLDAQAPQRAKTIPVAAPVADGKASTSSPAPGLSTDPIGHTLRNKMITRVADQDVSAPKRQRGPYVKWSKEEDELLTQAVAKYGQKWDLVQKALPSRGYHQVRQRWLRKLGVFDNKPDLTTFQATTLPSPMSTTGTSVPSEPPPNPKLGLAPLSSEVAFSSLHLLSGRGDSRPPSSMPS